MARSAHRSFLAALRKKPAPGETGKEVEELQKFLTRFGYLKTAGKKEKTTVAFHEEAPPPQLRATPGTFDDPTRAALRAYQTFHGLPPTGDLDMGTLTEMALPRCGVPDVVGGSSQILRFVTRGRWDETELTYRVATLTSKVTEKAIRQAVRMSFDLWSEVTPLKFTETDSAAHFVIGFHRGAHGDGHGFDGKYGELAHAFFPGGARSGQVHFDEDEPWAFDFPPTRDAIDLMTVAAHEIGHALGLDHSEDAGAIMFPTYKGPHRFLNSDDIAGIRTLYGARDPGWIT